MVENLKDLKVLFLIADKIFNIYTLIKEKMYDGENYDEVIEQLKILLKLEKDELNKLELDYYYLEDLKERILNDGQNRYFNVWTAESAILINQLAAHQFNSIDGKKMFNYKYEDKREFIALRVYQNLNLLQTKCLNYPFDSIYDIINNEEFTIGGEEKTEIYISDVEKVTGIYTYKDYGKIDCFIYQELALKDDHVIALDSGLRERLYLEIKADYFLNRYYTYNNDKDNNQEIRNFYIDSMINMLYIVPLLEERLINSNFDLENKDKYMSFSIYKYKNNLKFLDIIRTRELIKSCSNFLELYLNYDNYNLSNYYGSLKDDNIISEFASIMTLISNIKACFNDKTRSNLLYSTHEFMKSNMDDDNNKLFSLLMKRIGEQESKVKTFTLK